jgi:aminobenzoyl-glutamate utilization protein B
MMVAAKTMTLTAMDLFSDPSHVVKARAELERSRGPSFAYHTRLEGRKPALDYRKPAQ